jgi:hypothetical protein
MVDLTSLDAGQEAGSGDAGTSVVSLVQQLKAGKMSKEELFEQLSNIQKAKKSVGTPQTSAAGASHAHSHGTHQAQHARHSADHSSSGLSAASGHGDNMMRASYPAGDAGPGRLNMVSGGGGAVAAPLEDSWGSPDARSPNERSLIERARQQYGAAQYGAVRGTGDALGGSPDVSFVFSPSPEPHPHTRPRSARNSLAGATRAAGSAGRVQRPRSASPAAGSRRRVTEPKAFDFATARRGVDSRAASRMRSIEAEREQLCTFKPTITKASGPDYLRRDPPRAGGTDLYERQLAWKRHKEEEVARRRAEQERGCLDGCTFHPMKAREFGTPARDAPPRAPSPARKVRAEEVSERLYQHGLDHRRQVQAELRTKLEEEMDRICTFKPDVNPHGHRRDPTPVKSRYRDAPAPREALGAQTSDAAREARELAECTFQPQVNQPKKSMEVAKLYLAEPAWLRLSRPRPVSPQPSDASVNAWGRARPASPAPQRPQSALTSLGGGTPQRGAPCAREGEVSESFADFLARQEDFVAKVELNLAEKQGAAAHHKGPRTNARSQRIWEKLESRGDKAKDFLERVQRTLQEKEARRRAREEAAEQALPFKPTINDASKYMRGRSWAELSHGDQRKHAEALEALKRDREQEHKATFTFKPKLNEVPGVQSRLKVASDPDNYLARVEHEARMAQRLQVKVAHEMRAEEMRECTFRPAIHDAPAYVRKIASSQKRRKEAESAARERGSRENSPPEWDTSVSLEQRGRVSLSSSRTRVAPPSPARI